MICDDQAWIRASTMGWSGSVHDKRVWRRSRFIQNQEVCFNEKQYLLGDSAFQLSNVMILLMMQDAKTYLAIFLKRTDSLISYFDRSIKFIILTEALIYYFNGSISNLF